MFVKSDNFSEEIFKRYKMSNFLPSLLSGKRNFFLILPKLQPLFQQQSENQYEGKILDTIGNNSHKQQQRLTHPSQ